MTFSAPNQPASSKIKVFESRLRTALNALYDPAILRASPLVTWLGLEQNETPAAALRRLILEAIETLRPQEKNTSASKSWRVYQILRRRYTEQILQRKVADDLGLSLRQLQREEKVARSLLTDYLWEKYDLEHKPAWIHPPETPAQAQLAQLENGGGAAGLAALRDTLPMQSLTFEQVAQDALSTLREVFQANQVESELCLTEHPVGLYLQAEFLRVALLNILNAVTAQIPGGKIKLSTLIVEHAAQLQLEAWPPAHHKPGDSVELPLDVLETGQSLLALCHGTLEVALPEQDVSPLFVCFTLPVAERVTVLVIDDNTDTLQLFQRYLTDSRYRFVGANHPWQGLALAESEPPRIIILDVMMPESDGWAVLGQLRVHPQTQDIPVIVCSIVPQGSLAQALGAAEFLRKPISQAELLATLDRQANLPLSKSG
jgi:CheY-like chemotaxis protein